MLLTRAVDGGYACHEALTTRPEWLAFRGRPRSMRSSIAPPS